MVSLPASARFEARRQGATERDSFEISLLDGAIVDGTGIVTLSDSATIHAVEVSPAPLPHNPSALDWRIVHQTVALLGAEESCYWRWPDGRPFDYVCIDWRHFCELKAAGKQVYSEHKNVVVWVKTNAGQGNFYKSQHELIFVFKNGEAPHLNNFELGQHGRNRSNIWEYAGANTFQAGRMEDLASHPTVKQVALVAEPCATVRVAAISCSTPFGEQNDCLGSRTRRPTRLRPRDRSRMLFGTGGLVTDRPDVRQVRNPSNPTTRYKRAILNRVSLDPFDPYARIRPASGPL